jgi:hypothetical protein
MRGHFNGKPRANASSGPPLGKIKPRERVIGCRPSRIVVALHMCWLTGIGRDVHAMRQPLLKTERGR